MVETIFLWPQKVHFNKILAVMQ